MKTENRKPRIHQLPLVAAVSKLHHNAPRALLGGLAVSAALAIPAQAQQVQRGSASAMLEEVVVTARKRTESMQDVPLSVSAFGSDQLQAMKIRDLTNLAVGMPNVALDDVATSRGYANFSIRGLGINSSIVSIDPTVGVFVDGVYLGISGGIIFDMFDLQSVEVLRGPQGILFGRNVTGGAVLINTRRPSEEFEASIKGAVDGGEDGGLNTYLMGMVSGPLGGDFSGRLTAYYNDDEGWFENQFDGEDFGAVEQKMIRPVLQWSGKNAELVFRWEHTEIESDGPASQNHTNGAGVSGAYANFKRDSHDFSIDEPGMQDIETDFVSIEYNLDVGFGDGTITNIFGWRNYEGQTYADIDAQPVWLFHSSSWTEAEQWSNELRYNGLFADKANVTTGLYYFTNDITYHEGRDLLGLFTGGLAPVSTQDGGGEYKVDTYAAFAAVDYDLTDKLTLNGGIRYSYEEKDAKIASLILNTGNDCNLVVGPACPFDFVDDDSWDSWSPKLGVTYHVSDDMRIYGHWARGFRSGGYNLRNTSLDFENAGPGPFDEEQVDSYEIGFKMEFGRGRLNGALFYNEIDDMQREVNESDPISGVVQVIKNTADAEMLGFELDGTFSLTDTLVLQASVGYVDPEYTEVRFDLNGDGVVDGRDEDLDLPRAAEWTYNIGLTHDLQLGDWGYIASRINYAYRDESYFTDNNLGWILEQEIVDAGIDFYSNDGHWAFGIYGRNLLDDVKHGGDTQLPDVLGPVPTGGTFSPLSKGRVYGLELTYNFL